MNGGGGGCIARYSGGGAGGGCGGGYGGGCGGGYGEIHYGMSKVQRIMLKYRPIAPKPMAAGSGSSCSTAEHGDSSGRNRRRKRRYVRVNGNNKKKDTNAHVSKKKMKASASSSENSGGGDAVVTLSLMPETPDRNENSPATSSPSENRDLTINYLKKPSPVLLSFSNYQQSSCDGDHTAVIPPPPPQKLIVTSFVTVECVTETWMTDDGSLGFTDQTRMMNMENDTCPSFITNCRDTVVWTNKAYKQMTTGGGGGGSDEMTTVVVLVKKVNRVTVPVSHPSFTCKVKVTWGAEKGGSPSSVTAPCDVWRLRSGGFAWRLDVKAALCLGPYN